MIHDWTDEREALLRTMWEVDGISASKCAAALGVTRNAVIGKVHRMHMVKRGKSSAAKPNGRNGAAGKYRGVVVAARRARAAKAAPPKPERIKLPPPEVFTPAGEDLAVGAWNALPGTTPVSMEALARDGCRWPIGEDAPFLFCGCKAATGSSYCATHKHRSVGNGTTDERMAPRSLKVISHLEVKNGFRSNQAGQSL
jgi:GcrA cell cycle regulator